MTLESVDVLRESFLIAASVRKHLCWCNLQLSLNAGFMVVKCINAGSLALFVFFSIGICDCMKVFGKLNYLQCAVSAGSISAVAFFIPREKFLRRAGWDVAYVCLQRVVND